MKLLKMDHKDEKKNLLAEERQEGMKTMDTGKQKDMARQLAVEMRKIVVMPKL